MDDGISGTMFRRPGLDSLVDEVKAGKVATVIIKDQSRIGRDVVEIGLLKRTFDEFNVRFMSAEDGLDTAKGFDIMSLLRDVFNEWYVADCSKKIRAVKQAKAQKGERVNGSAPYGYTVNSANKNHLLPDHETAPIVRKIFELFTKGMRMCDIQRWLEDNQVLSCGALLHKRTGMARFQKAAAKPYIWSEKTIYDMLVRQEYLGHTVTAKTHKVSFKSKKTVKNPEEKQYFFPDTHEPLIDEATFDLAQKRIATRNRPTKVNEIDLFSGLVFCSDCNYKMYLLRGKSKTEKTEAYVCGNYRNASKRNTPCTAHFIRRCVLKELVLADLRRVLTYVKEHERDFIAAATQHGELETKQTLVRNRKELAKAAARIAELDILFRKLYEDKVLGNLSAQQFAMLTSGYEDEKSALTKRRAELENEIAVADEQKQDVNRFVKLVDKYSDIPELNYEIAHEFIDRILIHDMNREVGTRKIEIFYSFVGRVDSGKEEPIANTTRFRKGMIDVKSFVI